MQLVKATDPILRYPVPKFTWPTVGDALLKLENQSDELRRIVEENELGALAANQVGLPINMLVLGQRCFRGVSKWNCKVFINPYLVGSGCDDGHWGHERSPNFPGLQVDIRRAPFIKLGGDSLTGKFITQALEHDGARAAARAVDCLKGITILDHSCLGYWGYEGVELDSRRKPGVPSRSEMYEILKERSRQLQCGEGT